MPDQTADATNASESGIDRRSLFNAISRVSLGLAATAAIAEQVKAAPAEETKADELEEFKYDIESEKGWVGRVDQPRKPPSSNCQFRRASQASP